VPHGVIDDDRLLVRLLLGVVAGITLEFQFGTNWSRYSEYVGDIFGSLLAIEATTSFFLESTFLGAWIFGWNILSPKMHAACIWLVAIASNLSAAWILLANAFMQNPVGYVLRNGRAELDNFFQVLLNPFGWQQYVHTLSGAFTLAGFFLMGVMMALKRDQRRKDQRENHAHLEGAGKEVDVLLFEQMVGGDAHEDQSILELYRDRELQEKTLAILAAEAVCRITGHAPAQN